MTPRFASLVQFNGAWLLYLSIVDGLAAECHSCRHVQPDEQAASLFRYRRGHEPHRSDRPNRDGARMGISNSVIQLLEEEES